MGDKHPLMKCGHVAQGVDGEGHPVCVICSGITPNAHIVDDNPPSLEGRMAICTSCYKHEVPSSYDLPFFEYGGDIKSAPSELITERNALLLRTRNSASLSGKPPLSEEERNRLRWIKKELRRQATRDGYYCGCMGWD